MAEPIACPGIEPDRAPPGEGPTCIGPDFGATVSSDWGGSMPVPLFFAPGQCTGPNPGASHALENPDLNWDGEDGQILTFINCSSGTENFNFLAEECPTAAPFGMIIAFYQTPDGAPDPATPGGCTNVIFPKNPGILGWCYSQQQQPGGCNYDIEPGEFQVLVQTDLIGGSCAPGTFNYTFSQ